MTYALKYSRYMANGLWAVGYNQSGSRRLARSCRSGARLDGAACTGMRLGGAGRDELPRYLGVQPKGLDIGG